MRNSYLAKIFRDVCQWIYKTTAQRNSFTRKLMCQFMNKHPILLVHCLYRKHCNLTVVQPDMIVIKIDTNLIFMQEKNINVII